MKTIGRLKSEWQTGFSLMEILIAMIIVAIIGGLAYPKYQKMVTRSKQSEAKMILKAIHMAQTLYMTEHDGFTDDLNQLDVEIPEKSRYTYTLTLGIDDSSYTATATGNIDSDPTVDKWQIDHTDTMENLMNDVIK